MPTIAEQIIDQLQLRPLPHEGGLFRETYRTPQSIPQNLLGGVYSGDRSFSTAIYYLLTSDMFSAMHRVPGDEIFHFYTGDPVEMLHITPDGNSSVVTLGPDILSGMRPQIVVPGGVWQGCRVIPGGDFALLGTTMAPGFDFDDYTHADPDELIALCPSQEKLIRELTR